jgi:hypothetical protein
MLAPSLLDIANDIAGAMNVIRAIDAFAESCLSAGLAQQEPPLTWITGVQSTLRDGRAVAQEWLNARPAIVPQLSRAFLNYGSLISAARSTVGATASGADWAKVLEALQNAARVNSERTRTVKEMVATQHTHFREVHQRLLDALGEVEQAEEEEIADIQKATSKIDELYARLTGLGAPVSSQAMAAGQSVVKTTAEITYKVLVAGEEVSALSVVATLYSIGDSVYTTVVTDSEIMSLLHQIARLMVRLSADARALAMMHTLRAMLERMNNAYAEAAQQLPRLNSYWDAEADKIGIIQQALRNGVAPADMTELAALPTAITVWQQISKMAKAMTVPEINADRVAELPIRLQAA